MLDGTSRYGANHLKPAGFRSRSSPCSIAVSRPSARPLAPESPRFRGAVLPASERSARGLGSVEGSAPPTPQIGAQPLHLSVVKLHWMIFAN
jgi:hypothetical protein